MINKYRFVIALLLFGVLIGCEGVAEQNVAEHLPADIPAVEVTVAPTAQPTSQPVIQPVIDPVMVVWEAFYETYPQIKTFKENQHEWDSITIDIAWNADKQSRHEVTDQALLSFLSYSLRAIGTESHDYSAGFAEYAILELNRGDLSVTAVLGLYDSIAFPDWYGQQHFKLNSDLIAVLNSLFSTDYGPPENEIEYVLLTSNLLSEHSQGTIYMDSPLRTRFLKDAYFSSNKTIADAPDSAPEPDIYFKSYSNGEVVELLLYKEELLLEVRWKKERVFYSISLDDYYKFHTIISAG